MNFFEKITNGDITSILQLGAAWFLFFTAKYHFELKRIMQWPSVDGNLIKLEYSEGDGTIPAIISVEYDFAIDGVEYSGRKLAHITFGTGRGTASVIKNMIRRVKRVGDDGVVVYYNPNKPQKNMLLKPGKVEYGFLYICYGGTILIAYLGFLA